MKPKRITIIGLASVLFAALFMALWKASAPVRVKRQLESQAEEQLRGRTTVSGNQFQRIYIRSLRYDAKLDFYDVQYSMEWSSPGGASSYTNSNCSLDRSRKTIKTYSGQCWAPHGLTPDKGRPFTMSLTR